MSMRTAALGVVLGFVIAARFTAAAQSAPTPPRKPSVAEQAPPGRWVVLLHGGTEALSSDQDKAYRAALHLAVQAAAQVLNANGSAVFAVEAALRVVEDNPLFPKSREIGLEASVMDGSNTKSGTVAGVRTTKNPISLAKVVLSRSENKQLSAEAADAFAIRVDLAQIPTEVAKDGTTRKSQSSFGVVVRDRMGNLAAGTTSQNVDGSANDIPLLVEQTYASNRSCAVASTGTGEAFLKLQVAHSICALVQYTGLDLQQAEDEVIQGQLSGLKGEGGVVAITPDGQLAWSFNTPAMLRARLVEGGTEQISIGKSEP